MKMKRLIDLALCIVTLLAILLPYARPVSCEASAHSPTVPLTHVVVGSGALHHQTGGGLTETEPGDGAPTSESADCHASMQCGFAPVAPILQMSTLNLVPTAETNLNLALPSSRGWQAEDLKTPPPRA